MEAFEEAVKKGHIKFNRIAQRSYHDTFVVLPTGYGKSVMYGMFLIPKVTTNFYTTKLSHICQIIMVMILQYMY